MSNGTTSRIALGAVAQATLRIMIASYFLAVALNIIPGTDLALLFSWAIPPIWAGALAAAIVFLLSFMVMIAVHTRVAALLLGLMVFYTSYLTMVELGVERELGAFWRDLALIAALLLTYSDAQPGVRDRRGPIHRHVAPRRVTLGLDIPAGRHATPVGPATAEPTPAPRSHAPTSSAHRPMPSPAPRAPINQAAVEPDIVNIFLDEDQYA
ncbi:hypothetical protein roselon_02651 [Roseibacterium elongatum DSM 19469]|uniref:DoxX family protein n=1 Tax=Roseicyclus elongatus DSM 19469 TaxID=1294273 RepID=W8S7S1_9RHOB|nr:hypothetical protein [Roseibacterium elongatum]AHM04961.1 hypothetical protein roselon_02651 [Roseibacterium elongatum DSM 19469]